MSRASRIAVVLFGAVLVPSVFVLIAGHSPWRVLVTLLTYSFGPQGWSEVLVYAIPMTLIALGVAFALRAGLFNIGGDGQLLAGALLAVAISPYLQGLGFAALITFLIVGFVGGALFAALAGWLRAAFGANEIIVTIMLNYVAAQMVSYFIRGPLQEPMRIFPRSFTIPDDCILPVLFSDTRLHAGLLVALIVALIMAAIQRRTVFGFQTAVIGANRSAADYAGFRTRGLTVGVMALSGGLAGLAGAVEVAGVYGRVEDNMADGFGLSGIAVALIARMRPEAIPVVALIFGVFFAGSGALQREIGLPFPLVWIVEATAIFTAAALLWALNGRKAVA